MEGRISVSLEFVLSQPESPYLGGRGAAVAKGLMVTASFDY